MAGPIASASAEINALSGRNVCGLIVEQMRLNDLNAKCTIYLQNFLAF
jgi:hypothetical protein